MFPLDSPPSGRDSSQNPQGGEGVSEAPPFAKELLRIIIEQHRSSDVLRWVPGDQPRFKSEGSKPDEESNTIRESLSEHTSHMASIATLLFTYAKKVGDSSIEQLDFVKVSQLIYLHDSQEMIVGDWPYGEKTTEVKQKEEEAQQQIMKRLSRIGLEEVATSLFKEYEQKQSPEARFVKAIDTLQALCTIIYHRRFDIYRMQLDSEDTKRILEYAREFPLLHNLLYLALRTCEVQRTQARRTQQPNS
ncbi:MAG: hypothetical protein KatS3mg100_035 [Candidatus Parcubacteria bacterium]|nr:MAG: hypothetical protein KatS3mg100_035 [Candidatus Parcubacteria bacterium]